jgi:hypothetical protein
MAPNSSMGCETPYTLETEVLLYDIDLFLSGFLDLFNPLFDSIPKPWEDLFRFLLRRETLVWGDELW